MSTCPGCVVSDVTKTRTNLNTLIPGHNNGGDVSLNRVNENDNDDEDDDDRIVLCPSCVHASLQYVQERHQSAKLTWYESRRKCAEYFQHKRNDIEHPNETERNSNKSIYLLDQKYQKLRKELEQLQHEVNTTTMETCSMNLRIIERQEYISTLEHQYATQRRQVLSKLQQTLCGYNNRSTNDTTDNNTSTNDNDNANPNNTHASRQQVTGALIHNIDMTKRMVRVLRFQWTLQAFQMFRLQIDDEDTKKLDNDDDDDDQTTSTNTSNTNASVNDGHSSKQQQQQHKCRTNRRKNGTKNMIVSGIGKICGLPLPHAGLELYGVLPYEELQSALRLVAQLTFLIARCLYIPLPHPIIIVPPPLLAATVTSSSSSPKSTVSGLSPQQHKQYVKSLYMGDIADSVFHDCYDHDNRDGSINVSTNTGMNRDVITSSLTSLSSLLVGGESRQSLSKDTIPSPQRHFTHQHHQHPQHQKSLLSTDPHQVEQRIRHAVSAIIAEDQSCKTFYTLSTDIKHRQQIDTPINATPASTGATTIRTNTSTSTTNVTQQQQNDEFAIALQLLQNNILVICINVGVPIHQLYPGEAILLNLYTLQQFCYQYIL